MTETQAYGYSSESTRQEISNEYQHDRVWMVFKSLCILLLWTKVASALDGHSIFFLSQTYKEMLATNFPEIFVNLSPISKLISEVSWVQMTLVQMISRREEAIT